MTRKCPNCGAKITGHPNKKFCNSRCKDAYHNRTNPRGYGRYEPKERDWYEPHPFSSEALGQWDD